MIFNLNKMYLNKFYLKNFQAGYTAVQRYRDTEVQRYRGGTKVQWRYRGRGTEVVKSYRGAEVQRWYRGTEVVQR